MDKIMLPQIEARLKRVCDKIDTLIEDLAMLREKHSVLVLEIKKMKKRNHTQSMQIDRSNEWGDDPNSSKPLNGPMYASKDIRNNLKKIVEVDECLEKWQTVIEDEMRAYKIELGLKTIDRIKAEKVEFQQNEQGRTWKCLIAIPKDYAGETPSMDNSLILKSTRQYSKLGKVSNLYGFSEIKVELVFEKPFEMTQEEQKYFDLVHVPILWRFSKMKEALQSLPKNKNIFDILTGKSTSPVTSFAAQDCLRLNQAQNSAVHHALSEVITIIVGPPGTGKTTTICSIASMAVNSLGKKVLAVAPSNYAIDHLTVGLAKTKLKVLRVVARGHQQKIEAQHEVFKTCLHVQERRGVEEWMTYEQILESVAKEKQKLMSEADIITTTVVNAASEDLKSINFSYLIVDEACQASEPETFIAIAKLNYTCHIVLVGDPKQLGPVTSTEAMKTSLMQRLLSQGNVTSTELTVQYRMHPSIASFSSETFYNGKIQNGISGKDRPLPCQLTRSPVIFMESFGVEETKNKTKFNRAEAAKIYKIVSELIESNIQSDQIAVICFYIAQKLLLQEFLSISPLLCKVAGKPTKDLSKVKVSTVDAFQGQECEIIILSTVRSNKSHIRGFLDDPRRMNVALTRARSCMIIVGNEDTLKDSYLWSKAICNSIDQSNSTGLGFFTSTKHPDWYDLSDIQVSSSIPTSNIVKKRIGALIGQKEVKPAWRALREVFDNEIGWSNTYDQSDRFRVLTLTSKRKSEENSSAARANIKAELKLLFEILLSID